MRKIKILTLLALMLGSIVTTQAQEKQNDATWEETIKFLKNNISKFNHTLEGDNNVSIRYEYRINSTKLEKIMRGKVDMRADLVELVSVEFEVVANGNMISLNFEKNSVEDFDLKLKRHEFNIGFCTKATIEPSFRCTENLWIEKDTFVQRILKAFKHLAYLANEKRKESKF